MAGIYKAVVRLRAASGVEQDDAQNVWHFLTDPDAPEVPGQTLEHAQRIRDIVRDFYTAQHNGAAVEAYISDTVSRAVDHEIAITRRPVDYQGVPTEKNPYPEHWGAPEWIFPMSFDVGQKPGSAYASECSAVLSIHADYGNLSEELGNTRPRSNRRGRKYIGPLGANAIGGVPPRLGDGVRAVMQAAADQLLDASNGALDAVHWATYSRKLGQAHRVIGGKISNDIAIQRRRGEKESHRNLFGDN